MSGTNSDNFFGQFLIIKGHFYFYYRKRFKSGADVAKQLHYLVNKLTRRALNAYSSLPLLSMRGPMRISSSGWKCRPKRTIDLKQ